MLLDIFAPYMSFISFFVTIIVNILLLKGNVNWVILVVGNLLVAIVISALGFTEYNFISQVIVEIGNIIVNIFKEIF